MIPQTTIEYIEFQIYIALFEMATKIYERYATDRKEITMKILNCEFKKWLHSPRSIGISLTSSIRERSKRDDVRIPRARVHVRERVSHRSSGS